MKKAFSLMELLLVIVILGTLATLVIPNLIGQSDTAKKKMNCLNMQSLSNSMDAFRSDNGVYPETIYGLEALVASEKIQKKYKNYPEAGYISKKNKPVDSWGNDYIYIKINANEYEIISFGADGEEGGTDMSKDMKLSECK